MTERRPEVTAEFYGYLLCHCLCAHEVKHSGRTLWDHLQGTYEILVKNNASQDVCLAGLFHSVYGTRVFSHKCLEPTDANRKLIRAVIGERAEHLAYLFGTIDRSKLTEPGVAIQITKEMSQDDVHDLQIMERANLLEQSLEHLKRE